MAPVLNLPRLTNSLRQDRLALQRAREVVAEATEVLQRCPRPDTFLGRKTQEPFPNEDETKLTRVAQRSSREPFPRT